jgi:hypothetical protein
MEIRMNISKENHEILLNEFKEINQMINSSEIIEDKLYYFTAIYGIINRVMNLQSDPTLIFIHQVLQNCHQAILQRLNGRVKQNVSTDTPDKLIGELFKMLNEFINAFESHDKIKIWEILQRFSNLSYAMSGNGYYMYLRNKINFYPDYKHLK